MEVEGGGGRGSNDGGVGGGRDGGGKNDGVGVVWGREEG